MTVHAQVRKLLDVLHEFECSLVVVPRIWIEEASDIVIDVVVVLLGITPSVVKQFGVAFLEVEVVLHSGFRISEVLRKSVTFCFMFVSVTTKFSRDYRKRNLLNTSFGIEESACKTLWLSTIKCVSNKMEAMYIHCGAVF